MSQPMTIEEYSEKAFVVRGNTKHHKEALMTRHGRYNPNLHGGAGWVFSKRHLKNIQTYISECSPGSLHQTPHSRKRKRVVDIDYYKKKLRKTIKKEVEREFAYQKPFMLAQWRAEITEEKQKYINTLLRKTHALKQILTLFIFILACLVSFHLGQKGVTEYVSVGWTNHTYDGWWCQFGNVTATIPIANVSDYQLFTSIYYPCWR